MKIKVCGMTDIAQINELADLGIDFCGMIFYKLSKRYCVGKISTNAVAKISSIKKVGVFVNEDIEKIKQTVKDYKLDFVQLHGNETAEDCGTLSNFCSVIKVFSGYAIKSVEKGLKNYLDSCEYFLFDTPSESFGGSGLQFDWIILNNFKIEKKYFLSGGISLESVDEIVKLKSTLLNPENLFAVDINSKFEISAGIKDMNKVKLFSEKIKLLN